MNDAQAYQAKNFVNILSNGRPVLSDVGLGYHYPLLSGWGEELGPRAATALDAEELNGEDEIVARAVEAHGFVFMDLVA